VRKALAGLVKISLSLGIIVYMVVRATQDQAFTRLVECPKNWPLLGLATVMLALGVALLNVRWCILARALELPVSQREAMRVGFLGFLFNFLPLGVVAGDVLKIVVLGRRLGEGTGPRVTASVAVDRLLGLFLLFFSGSLAILVTGFWRLSDRAHAIAIVTIIPTLVGAGLIAVLCVPAITGHRSRTLLQRIPSAGALLVELADSLNMYRRNRGVLVLASAISLASITASIAGFHCIALGLYDHVPSFGQHFVAGTVAGTTGAIPLSFGPFEAVYELIYVAMGMPVNQGFIMALAWRIMTLVIAVGGVGYFFIDRRDGLLLDECDDDGLDAVKSAA